MHTNPNITNKGVLSIVENTVKLKIVVIKNRIIKLSQTFGFSIGYLNESLNKSKLPSIFSIKSSPNTPNKIIFLFIIFS